MSQQIVIPHSSARSERLSVDVRRKPRMRSEQERVPEHHPGHRSGVHLHVGLLHGVQSDRSAQHPHGHLRPEGDGLSSVTSEIWPFVKHIRSSCTDSPVGKGLASHAGGPRFKSQAGRVTGKPNPKPLEG